jgi:hypothetical protein
MTKPKWSELTARQRQVVIGELCEMERVFLYDGNVEQVAAHRAAIRELRKAKPRRSRALIK